MLTQYARLLVDTGAVVPSSSEVVTAVSASLMEHVRPAPEDLPEGGVHLLSHAGLLVLLFLNHPELLVLIILGQPFQFEGQLLFKLSLGLGSFF